ncbi:MAG: glycosyltransferase [Hymenobacter sp.]|nr:MAG: glycosyltransferase [Hymenobacter sp.]
MQFSEVGAVRIPTAAPAIAALPPGPERPLWSVMIPTYNCTPFLIQALRSVLAQDPGPAAMHIEVVDDAGTDADVAALVAELGAGRVQYFRQPRNVGSLRNFETCLNRSRGHLVHLLHGDDLVLPGFYQAIGGLFEQYPSAGAAFSHYASIDEAGRRTHRFGPLEAQPGLLPNWLLRIAQDQCLQYACMVVRRAVYERLGSFYGTDYGEDWEMWVRIARYYPVAYTPALLAEYRGRTTSITAEKERLGHVMASASRAIALIQQHLPAADKQRIAERSRQRYAYLGIGGAYRLLRDTRDWSLAQGRIRQSLALSRHPTVYVQVLKFYLKALVRW